VDLAVLKPQKRKPYKIWEFEEKEKILKTYFKEVSPEEYFKFFHSEEEIIVVFGGNKKKRGTIKRVSADDVGELWRRKDAYIPYTGFYRNYYHGKTVKSVKAFVVDIDHVSPRVLKKIVVYGLKTLPKPTYIVNSGHGIHLVYALVKEAEIKGLRYSVNKLNTKIQGEWELFGEVDKHPITHSYRYPGFATKINTVATVYECGSMYELTELFEFFGVKVKVKKKAKAGKRKKKDVLIMPNAKRGFFEWALIRLFKSPPIPGRRHNSFFAFGIISYKCKREVPKEEAVEAVDMIYDDMERRGLNVGFTRKEAHTAFEKGYNQKAVLARWSFLCDLLGWEYRKNKRNGRTREEHLLYVQKIRKIQKEEKEKRIKELLEKGYKKTEIAVIMGISRRNLYQTYGHILGVRSSSQSS